MIYKIERIFKFAFQDFWRNFWLSMVTISIMVLTLITINFFILAQAVLQASLVTVEDKVSMTVYFKPATQTDDALSLADDLRKLPEVKNIEYISKDVALDRLKKKYSKENNAIIEESLRELDVNPLSASIIIKARSVEEYPPIQKILDSDKYQTIIEKKNFEDRSILIQRIKDLKEQIRIASIGIIFFFVIIIVLIIFNTIRITIYSRKREIGIMKLVGATNWFIRMPLIVEVMMYGVISLLLTILIVFPLLSFVQAPLARFFDGNAFDVIGYFNDRFFLIFGYQLLAAVFLSMVSGLIAMGRYLKV